jgi:VWFA-related protein
MKRSSFLAIPMSLVTSFVLVAQQETIRVDVPVVFLPVTVTDEKGKYIDGLEAADFELTDNGKVVPFEMSTSDAITAPLALVVVVQANENTQPALEKIQKVGSVIPALISGARGSVYVMSFGDEVKTIQDWTRDEDDISRAFRYIKPQWDPKARMLDAVSEGVQLLSERAPEERRILLVIGETKDRGSKADLKAVAEQAQRAGVMIQAVTFSAYATAFTKKGGTNPDSRHSGGNILGIFSELGRLGKENTVEVLTLASGGRSRGFTTLHGLEDELGHVGEEVHSQYLLNFTPASPKPGFHQLFVRVKDRKDAVVRTRPGYWAGEAKP